MNRITQNLKSGFANMKELLGIMLKSDDTNNEFNNYDIYINGNDQVLAQTAQQLKEIEEIQEIERLSLLDIKEPKEQKTKPLNKSKH